MKRVLLVEDDAWLAEHFCRVLRSASYDVISTSTAHQAIDLIDDYHPDVLVLDVMLTGSTAFALMNELQSYDDTGALPVILCTNLAGDVAKTINVSDYNIKSILDKSTMKPEDLILAIKKVFLDE